MNTFWILVVISMKNKFSYDSKIISNLLIFIFYCVLALQASRKSLMDTVSELYDPNWGEVEDFQTKSDVSIINFFRF